MKMHKLVSIVSAETAAREHKSRTWIGRAYGKRLLVAYHAIDGSFRYLHGPNEITRDRATFLISTR